MTSSRRGPDVSSLREEPARRASSFSVFLQPPWAASDESREREVLVSVGRGEQAGGLGVNFAACLRGPEACSVRPTDAAGASVCKGVAALVPLRMRAGLVALLRVCTRPLPPQLAVGMLQTWEPLVTGLPH